MHVVAVCGWKDESPDRLQALAASLVITLYEARQRIIGGGPAVVASFADPQQAGDLAARLENAGISFRVIDSSAVCGAGCSFMVRSFEIGQSSLCVSAADGSSRVIPYEEIGLLLPALSIQGHTETRTVTERKLSLGKTLLSGGIPMTKKVSHQEEVRSEERSRLLYLYAGDLRRIVFSQDGMTYETLGPLMKPSREMNFATLVNELQSRAGNAVWDDRLLTRVGQIKLLGPAQHSADNLDLAAEVLAACLLKTGKDLP